MGGALTICNRTKTPLHVSLGQVGPLYWENFLNPGQCMDRHIIGKVWFTISVWVAHESNVITPSQAALSIIASIAGAIAFIALVGCGYSFVTSVRAIKSSTRPIIAPNPAILEAAIIVQTFRDVGAGLRRPLSWALAALIFAGICLGTGLHYSQKYGGCVADKQGIYADGSIYEIHRHANGYPFTIEIRNV